MSYLTTLLLIVYAEHLNTKSFVFLEVFLTDPNMVKNTSNFHLFIFQFYTVNCIFVHRNFFFQIYVREICSKMSPKKLFILFVCSRDYMKI